MIARYLSGLAIVFCLATSPASAATYTFIASLSGASASPPNGSPGTGTATILWDTALMTMDIDLAFADLVGTTTAAHIHAATAVPFTGTAGVATELPSFAGFPTGVTSGTYNHEFDLSDPTTFNPAFVSANGGTASSAADALLAAILGGKAYLNIHTTFAPSGEIRGFLVQSVPLPAGLPLLVAGIVALAIPRRLRR